MRKRRFLQMSLVAVWISLSFGLVCLSASAQMEEREKPKLKDFGSSLKRMRWDAERNVLIETRSKAEKGKTAEDEVVRVETSLVVSDVLVLDRRGNPVQSLTGADFVVTEDGQPQQIGIFSLGDNASVSRSIVLIVDYSCSQTGFLETSIEAAKTLVDKLGPRDRMAIVTDDVELLADFTTNKKKLKEKLEFLKLKGLSYWSGIGGMPWGYGLGRGASYSALMATLKEAFDDEDERPIIIVQSDGAELGSLRNTPINISIPEGLPRDEQEKLKHFKRQQKHFMTSFALDDVYRAAEKSRATIYTVIPAYRLVGLTPDKQLAQIRAQYVKQLSPLPNGRDLAAEHLKKIPTEAWQPWIEIGVRMQSALGVLSTMTGGWTEFLEEPSQAAVIYSRIFSDINRRYVVGYYPTNKQRDGKRRKMNIQIKGHPEYTVMGRKSYFAPERER